MITNGSLHATAKTTLAAYILLANKHKTTVLNHSTDIGHYSWLSNVCYEKLWLLIWFRHLIQLIYGQDICLGLEQTITVEC